jgi:hypothetical protein
LYLGGYIFLTWAVLWSLIERPTLVWTLGIWILVTVGSALLVHFRRHQTWEEFIRLLFGNSAGVTRTTARNAFQWLAAWAFPIWCVILLRELQVSDATSWLGLTLPALVYLGLACWLRRVDATYATPLFNAAQFYTAIGLLISTPVTIDFLAGNCADKNALVAFTIRRQQQFFSCGGGMDIQCAVCSHLCVVEHRPIQHGMEDFQSHLHHSLLFLVIWSTSCCHRLRTRQEQGALFHATYFTDMHGRLRFGALHPIDSQTSPWRSPSHLR